MSICHSRLYPEDTPIFWEVETQLDPILGFWVITLVNKVGWSWNFDQRFPPVCLTVTELFLKNSIFYDHRSSSKFEFLVQFWAQFTPLKTKILPKTKIFPETGSLGLSNYTSPRSQINQGILIKIFKKKHFLGQKCTFQGTK